MILRMLVSSAGHHSLATAAVTTTAIRGEVELVRDKPSLPHRRPSHTHGPLSRQGTLRISGLYFRGGSWHPSAAEPLLDSALFDAAQAVLAERAEDYNRRFAGRHPAYLLSGLITCGACGRYLVEIWILSTTSLLECGRRYRSRRLGGDRL